MESNAPENARRITGERMTNVVALSREELHAVSVKFRATVESILNDLPPNQTIQRAVCTLNRDTMHGTSRQR